MNDELRELVEARLRALPSDQRISIGSEEYSKEDLIEHVQKGDETGRQLMQSELEFLQAMAQGKIYDFANG